MALSRRPLVEFGGTVWLGDPTAAGFSIEVGDEALVMTMPSSVAVVRWADIEVLEVDIPMAPWWQAKALFAVLSTMDGMQVVQSEGAHSGGAMRRGNKDIAVRATLRDGSVVEGWAPKHQVLGYPEPEARAAIAVLQGRIAPKA